MPLRPFNFHAGAIHIPELGLWMDPHDPVTGPERVFVSHAHSDHTAPHREVILSEPTGQLMQSRLGGERLEHRLPFCARQPFAWAEQDFHLTLLPAGHIFGSAMALVEWRHHSLLYTGDFKLRQGQSAETCNASAAHGVDILIMETTFGRPHYQFPPTAAVMQGIVRFCREALDNDEVPILLGYSLGKSQELLYGLAQAGLPIMLHSSVERLTKVYEQLGHRFPAYETYAAGRASGKVLICPPNSASPHLRRTLGRVRTAVLTGWAVDPGCRFRYQADAAFPLSDHADFADLIRFVREIKPRQVFTLHGFAADFAETLRHLGFHAQPLSEDDQLMLPLATGSKPLPVAAVDFEPSPFREAEAELKAEPEAASPEPAPADSFAAFAVTCLAVMRTASKLEKVKVLAQYLRTLDPDCVPVVVTWFTGLPFPSSDNKVLKLGWAILRDALCQVGRLDAEAFRQVYLKHSDTGETAFEIFQHRTSWSTQPGPRLTISSVHTLFHRIEEARGPALKLGLLSEALRRCSADEARFLVKIITGDLRIGLKEGLVEEAVAAAFEVAPDELRRANLLLGNIGEAAALARVQALHTAEVAPFRPVKFMLASPEATAEDIWKRLRPETERITDPGDQNATRNPALTADDSTTLPTSPRVTDTAPREEGNANATPTARDPIWLEDKYDGIRCQLHKVDRRVSLYSRDLKDITATFPEIADAARAVPQDFILDGEILAMRDEVVLPFSELQKRLGRREGDLFLGAEIPVQLVAFDLLWIGGRSLLRQPLSERREALLQIPFARGVRLAAVTRVNSPEEIEAAFGVARGRNNEGLMAKDPNSIYTPGRRGLAWLKLKKALATLDCVVVGAEYGHGKRSNVLSDYTFAVREESTGALKTIGKAYTGLTDVEIAELTRHFLSRVTRQRGRYHEVEPDVVLEIAFDRIQPSARHNSGLALRFPRIVRIRTDKSVDQIDTVASARRLAGL